MNEHHCIHCGTTAVNLWKSWNLAGEWVCDNCWPDDPDLPAEDDA